MPFLDYRNQRIHYRVAGKGNTVLVAVHGFLGSMERWRPLSGTLEQHYRVYYFDLPFHGRTEWQLPKVLPDDLLYLLDWTRRHANADAVELMGYSLGAKVSMNLYLKAPEQIKRLWLLAPDGMQTKYLHWVEKLPDFMFERVARMGDQPERLQNWAKGLQEKGVLPPMAYQFVQWNLSTPERRRRAVAMWHTLRDFAVRPKVLKRTLEAHATPLELLLGKQDPYIPYAVWKDFGERTAPVNVHSRDTGHRLLDRTTAAWVEQRIGSRAAR